MRAPRFLQRVMWGLSSSQLYTSVPALTPTIAERVRADALLIAKTRYGSDCISLIADFVIDFQSTEDQLIEEYEIQKRS